jgi:predicted kinase
MDLRYRGRPDLAEVFIEQYLKAADDPDHREVLGFYAMHSACVRGKVEAFLLNLPEIPEKEKRRAKRAAARYFELAVEYARQLPPAMLVITCGLPGTGKSSLARALAERSGFEVISSDVVRKELAGVEPGEHRYEAFRQGIYSGEITKRTYEALLGRAAPILHAGRSVILDASFSRREQRSAARRLGQATGAQFACIYLAAGDEEVRRRITRRVKEGTDPSDASWEIYLEQKRRFQKPSEVLPERLISLGAGTRVAAQIRAVVKAMRTISPLSISKAAGSG